MSKQDIIVIGASAGGVEALKVVAAGFPADLPACVFVVLHIGDGINGQSFLPDILAKAGPLPAVRPTDGESLQLGRIYVAPPDYHLLLGPGHLHLSHGPKENQTRPAINPLFRSAAAAYGERVTGVILTGLLDDGVAGLAEIKRQGGVAVAEDPATAMFPSMPYNATLKVERGFRSATTRSRGGSLCACDYGAQLHEDSGTYGKHFLPIDLSRVPGAAHAGAPGKYCRVSLPCGPRILSSGDGTKAPGNGGAFAVDVRACAGGSRGHS